ncbi:MAG: nucleotidyltransferase domain-containing protein [Deltaproteobacteria bacterium]|nr:nucleotidyltransferase domain-containing protein [Deltaproteobacteria bacterium]
MVENQIKSYFESENDLVAVYLFGSYAAGNVRSGSDIDLAILFDIRKRAAVNRRLDKYLIDLSRLLRKDIHLTAMDFASEALLKQIFSKGKCIIVNDAKKMAYFKMIAYSKIAGFNYYRCKMQSGVIRKVMEGV